MNAVAKPPAAAASVELTLAGWFAVLAAIAELGLRRVATFVGVYRGVGDAGPLAWMAYAGEIAMYAAGFASLGLVLVTLHSIIGDGRYPGAWWRAILILVSPVYLLVSGLAAFGPALSPWLLLAAYASALLTAVLLAGVAIALPIGAGPRIVLAALAVANLLQGFYWTAIDFAEIDGEGRLAAVAGVAFVIAQALWILAPIAAFFCLVAGSPARLLAFLRRPPLPALLVALLAGGAAAAAIAYASGSVAPGAEELSWIRVQWLTFGAVGVALSFPGAPGLYVAAVFFAALTAAALALPDRRRPADAGDRRLGFGLALIWVAGIQPCRVFQFALMVAGFALAVRGALARVPAPEPRPEPSLAEVLRELDAGEPPKGLEHGNVERH